MNKDAKIYVAGHRGLVGSAIVRRLHADGFSNIITRSHAELDLTDQQAVSAFFENEKPEYVFLAAAKVGGILANSNFPAEFIYSNLMVQNNTINAAYRNGVKKLLFLGSSCIYPKHAPQPMKEEHLLSGPLEPTNEWYAIAKIAGIKMCQAYRKQYGFNAISLMPTNLYGPNDTFDLEKSHVLPALVRKFHLARLARLASAGNVEAIEADESRHGRIPDDILFNLGLCRDLDSISRHTPHASPKVVLWGSGSPYREFLHVDDLADACVFLMQNYDSGEIVNIGVGEDITIKALAGLVQQVVGFDGEVVWDVSKPDGTPRKLMDVSKLKQLGWQAKIELEQGIRDVYQEYCKSGQDRSFG
jgi:GDP-L-fucose synthase